MNYDYLDGYKDGVIAGRIQVAATIVVAIFILGIAAFLVP